MGATSVQKKQLQMMSLGGTAVLRGDLVSTAIAKAEEEG